MKRTQLTGALDTLLALENFSRDVSNNGLQVEGGDEVRRAAFAVDGCLETIERAVERHADFLFVHHGLSWGAEPRRLTGMNARRFGALFRAGMSLYAAHLPLDAHPVFGNNARLSDLIGLGAREPWFEYDFVRIGCLGTLPGDGCADSVLAGILESGLGAAVAVGGPDGVRRCHRVAVCSGGGGLGALEAAAAAGADTLLTGELTHVMHHPARELGIRVLAPGHYATETVGPRALMREIQTRFGLECEFLDIPTGR